MELERVMLLINYPRLYHDKDVMHGSCDILNVEVCDTKKRISLHVYTKKCYDRVTRILMSVTDAFKPFDVGNVLVLRLINNASLNDSIPKYFAKISFHCDEEQVDVLGGNPFSYFKMDGITKMVNMSGIFANCPPIEKLVFMINSKLRF